LGRTSGVVDPTAPAVLKLPSVKKWPLSPALEDGTLLDSTNSGATRPEPLVDCYTLIESARRHLDMSEEELRIAHWGCGGETGADELSAFLAGERALPDSEYNTLAAAINDRLIEANSLPSVPYSDDGD
jgi:hypothetical protein